ncbi:MAG TPA: carboxypeptidase regulatory-like domain-containing protein, partial [Pyrinomonadaceae bacterium]|nr:carboxypeptidase regulatory-like domain-containing protein [Pyrinomonadaceae bacterium]
MQKSNPLPRRSSLSRVAVFFLLLILIIAAGAVTRRFPTPVGTTAGVFIAKTGNRQTQRTQPLRSIAPRGESAALESAGGAIHQTQNEVAAQIFADPATLITRTAEVPTSSLALAGNGNGQDPANRQPGERIAQSAPENDRARRRPREERLVKAHEFKGDLRQLPRTRPPERERRELEPPPMNPSFYVPPGGLASQGQTPETQTPSTITPQANAPAPPPSGVFEGLDRFNWGAGSPPDTNGDVGPNHFIQTVNTSIGVFRKSDGFMEAAFTFNTFMSQGAFGNLCDTNNFGDPVVLYDTFEDRWIITDFAFLTDVNGNVLAPAYQCIAASQSGDPILGGWNFYSRQISDNLNDYPKFGVWPDGLYMSANMFSFGAGSTFKNARVWAFNKAQMYAGSPTVKVVSFDVGGGDFTVVPSNARLQTGTPPPGRENMFVSTWLFLNALTVYKFHVDWNSIALSTFTGPDTPVAATSWPNASVANVPQSGTSQLLDALQIRAMVQNQYTNLGGTESLWLPHTVRRANTTGFAAPRWYQVNVTGGTVAPNLPQATTWDPDGANVIHRWMPSLALDRAGNLAMGYSTSSSSTFPSIKYAGRLAGDPVNTFSLTEQTLFTGTASQLSSTRWGDYSAMTLDPDGCTFWITNEYATGLDNTTVDPTSFNKRWKTKFGNIGPFPGCVPVGAGGTVSGTVTVNPGGAPIPGATVNLGVRTTTTDGSGNYSFTGISAGTYPSMDASKPGFGSASAPSIVVTDGNITTQNFSLTDAPDSACLTDTTQADFLTGVGTNVDLITSPGNVTLSNAPAIDQQNTAGTTTGTGFGTPAWTGQTFIPAVTGQLAKADVQLFCNACGATPPNLTLSVRNTSAGVPTGADLATATIPGSTFSSGSTVLYTATFGSPATLTSGTQYALILRPVSAPAGSGYFWIRSSPSTYANGSRVLSADSGATWSADTTRDYNFKTYMQTGYAASGNLVSSPKDSNPSPGFTPIWSTFSWNGSTPANTSLKFQIAGSNNVNGPFNFVGPDGTAATFFITSPVQLSPQFYNFRYLEYKAYLATTNSNVTPTLNDATICFNDVDCSSTTATITPTPVSVCTNSTGNTASGPAGMTSYAWGITNGTITSATNIQTITYTAGASGTVTLSLTVAASNGCIASNSVPVTIDALPPTPTISGDTNGTGTQDQACPEQPLTLHANGATGATSYQWYKDGNPIAGETVSSTIATGAGTFSVRAINGSCTTSSSAVYIVQNPTPHSPFISFRGQSSSTTSLAICQGQSQIIDSDSPTGIQWYKDGVAIPGANSQSYAATQSGVYTAQLDALGCHSQ